MDARFPSSHWHGEQSDQQCHSLLLGLGKNMCVCVLYIFLNIDKTNYRITFSVPWRVTCVHMWIVVSPPKLC